MSTVIDTLIYDRTQADIDRLYELKNKILTQGLSALTADEKTEYMNGMRGAYNYGDLNRVGNATSYIANRMTTIPGELKTYREGKGVSDDEIYNVPYDPDTVTVNPKTDWAITDTPAQQQINTYLADLRTLRKQLDLPIDTPQAPATLDNLTFTTANNIEKMLFVVDKALTETEQALYNKIDNTANAFTYAGISYCGE